MTTKSTLPLPSAHPADPPAINAIPQFYRLPQTEESGLDLQGLQPLRRCCRDGYGWCRHGLTGNVEGIALGADLNRELRVPWRHGPRLGGLSWGEGNDLSWHVMTHYLCPHPLSRSSSRAAGARLFLQVSGAADLLKQAPLLVPVNPVRNGPQLSFGKAR